MTASVWPSATEPELLLDVVHKTASQRKLRLFSVACCRRIWPLLKGRGHEAVETAERLGDGLGTEKELRSMARAVVGGFALAGSAALMARRNQAVIAAHRSSESAAVALGNHSEPKGSTGRVS